MGFFDRFKFKKGEVGARPHQAKQAKKEENVLDLVKDVKSKKQAAPVVLKESTGNAFSVLLRSHVSEKATAMAGSGRYVFRIHPGATKAEVKKAVQRVYDVHVTAVNVITMQGKKRRYGRTTGRTAAWKKAVVTLTAGERIEGLSESL